MGEEIDGADDREVVADAEHGGIVGRMEAGDQLIGCRLGTKSGEGLGQQIGTELGRTPAAIGECRQAQARDLGQARHTPMMARADDMKRARGYERRRSAAPR